MDKLFVKYPTITYANSQCKDLSRRVKVSDQSNRNPYLFYPLTLTAGLRADSLADAYYGDAELDWLIWISNKTVDTYYDWYLDERDFNKFIETKYGTLEYAQEKTIYWRNNWHGSDIELPPSVYENNIAMDDRRYYSPDFGPNGNILSYTRKKVDWTVTTNKILQYEIVYVSGNSFSNGEILDIKYSGEIVGGAEVVVSNATSLIINHTTGNTHANTGIVKTLIGETSTTQATSNSVSTLQEVITNADARFWSKVSYFDWENEKNEKLKHMKIMDKTYQLDITEEFRKLLKE